MKIPDNHNEQEVIDIIDGIANRLCYKFKFGYHSPEDMKQQARLFAWEGLDKYDGKRPLENFFGRMLGTAFITSKEITTLD